MRVVVRKVKPAETNDDLLIKSFQTTLDKTWHRLTSKNSEYNKEKDDHFSIFFKHKKIYKAENKL